MKKLLLIIISFFHLVVQCYSEIDLSSQISQFPQHQNISITLEANMNYYVKTVIILQNKLEILWQENIIKFNISDMLMDSLIFLEFGDAFFSNLIFSAENLIPELTKHVFSFRNSQVITFQVFI